MTENCTTFPLWNTYMLSKGDETFKTFWKSSDAITALHAKRKLKTYEEVQSYFGKNDEKKLLNQREKNLRLGMRFLKVE